MTGEEKQRVEKKKKKTGGEGGEREGETRKFREMQRQDRGGMEREREDGGEAEWEELEENNKERWGGTGYATFLLTTASNQITGKHDTL